MDELLQTAPCGFLSFRDDGRMLQVNQTLAEWLDYSPGELDGRPFVDILTVPGRIFYQTHFFPLLKLQGRCDEIYLALRKSGGEHLPVLLNALRHQREGNDVFDCALLPMHQRSRYEDEILRARRQAEEATRARDVLLAVVSHELRSPLNAILGWADMLLCGEVDPGDVTKALDIIVSSAHQQTRLIDDLLDHARISSGKMRLDMHRLDLEALLISSVESLRPLAETRRIRLLLSCEPLSGLVWGDAGRLLQVIRNLLSNALKFTPAQGIIRASLRPEGERAILTVSDSGNGIAPEFLPHVFDPFRQADTATDKSGIGLGLSIVRRLIELHDGEIQAYSPGLGQGSSFEISLPLRPESTL